MGHYLIIEPDLLLKRSCAVHGCSAASGSYTITRAGIIIFYMFSLAFSLSFRGSVSFRCFFHYFNFLILYMFFLFSSLYSERVPQFADCLPVYSLPH